MSDQIDVGRYAPHPPSECSDPSSCPLHSEAWHHHHGCTCVWPAKYPSAEPETYGADCPAPHHQAPNRG